MDRLDEAKTSWVIERALGFASSCMVVRSASALPRLSTQVPYDLVMEKPQVWQRLFVRPEAVIAGHQVCLGYPRCGFEVTDNNLNLVFEETHPCSLPGIGGLEIPGESIEACREDEFENFQSVLFL